MMLDSDLFDFLEHTTDAAFVYGGRPYAANGSGVKTPPVELPFACVRHVWCST